MSSADPFRDQGVRLWHTWGEAWGKWAEAMQAARALGDPTAV